MPGISSQIVLDTSGEPGAGSAKTIGDNDARRRIGIRTPVLSKDERLSIVPGLCPYPIMQLPLGPTGEGSVSCSKRQACFNDSRIV